MKEDNVSRLKCMVMMVRLMYSAPLNNRPGITNGELKERMEMKNISLVMRS